MNKKQVVSSIKKLTAGILAIGMLVTGMVIYPKQADATDTIIIEDKVIYEKYEEDTIKTNYWTANKKTAPEKEGYVFGGWFKQVAESEKSDKAESYIDENDQTTYYDPLTIVDGEAYAKFVPAQVLSVKAQNEAKVTQSYIDSFTNEQDSFYVRVMTSLDSENYKKVGFDIYLGNWKKVYKNEQEKTPTETSKIYTGVRVSSADGSSYKDKTAEEIFGGVSEYVAVWPLTEINYKENVSLIIYVRPYWETMDGTKVNGLAKYVHIEDEYKGYISVPINISSKEDIAAGTMNMTYEEGLELAKDNNGKVLFEEGRIFPNMSFSHKEDTKIIKMVGHESTVGEYVHSKYVNDDETIYANIRFVKPTLDEDTTFDFNMSLDKFCDWAEKSDIDVKVWDIAYEVKASNN